jgi:hypothetical protein
MPVLNVHVFKTITLLLSVQLVKQGFLQIHTLDVQYLDQTLVVALVGKQVVHRAALVTQVDLAVDDLRGRAHVCHEIQHDVFESQVTVSMSDYSND